MLKGLQEIGQIVLYARAFNPHNWNQPPMEIQSLLRSVKQLFALLDERSVDYVLVGGIALLNYIEGRNTQDLDLIMSKVDLAKLPEIRFIQQDNPYFVQGNFAELRIDILLTQNPIFQLIKEKYTDKQPFLEQKISIAKVEGLLLLKLYALPSLYRQGDFIRVNLYENDIASLLYLYDSNVNLIIETLAKYIGEGDLISIKGILKEIQGRIKRFRANSSV